MLGSKKILTLIVDFYSTKNMPKSLKRDFVRIFQNSVDSDALIEGNSCRRFEENFAHYLGLNHVIGVGNGFDAIKIGLQSLGIGKGDRVAVPAHTFIATWFAIMAIGAIPVGIDVTAEGQINLDLLEGELDLKAVIPVHMHGTHCDMKRLVDWAKTNGVKVLEDCAQSAGLSIQGRMAGAWGDVAAFSFYPTKNLFALGDGGAIATNDPNIRERARLLSRYGSDKDNKYIHKNLGQNSRLDTIQAGFLMHSLGYLDEWNQKRADIAGRYCQFLGELEIIPKFTYHSVYHHFLVMVEERDAIKLELSRSGIHTEIHYPHVAGIEAGGGTAEYFRMSSIIAKSSLSLPISPWQNSKQTDYVIKALQKIINEFDLNGRNDQ
jgi:dTDP-4-amino-4,6-dideoxygalactose transaminase